MEESKMNTENIARERVLKQDLTNFVTSNIETETSDGMDAIIKTVAGDSEDMLHILNLIKDIESAKLQMRKQSK